MNRSKAAGKGLAVQVRHPQRSQLHPAQTVGRASNLFSACAVAVQDLANLKVEELTPLTPEVISRQATINIGAARTVPQLCVLRGHDELASAVAIVLGRNFASACTCGRHHVLLICRHHRTRGARQVDSRQSHFWCANSALQE